MSSLNGNFKEYMLIGGLFILPVIILLLIDPKIPNIFGIDSDKLYHSIEKYKKFHSGIFMSAIIASVSIISIAIGFSLELFGSLAFRAEAVILNEMITENQKIYSSSIRKYGPLVAKDEKYITENNITNMSYNDIWRCRKAARNIESFLVLCCAEDNKFMHNEMLLRGMSSLRIARGMSWLAVHAIMINCLAIYVGILKDTSFVVGVFYLVAAVVVFFSIYWLVDKPMKKQSWRQPDQLSNMKKICRYFSMIVHIFLFALVPIMIVGLFAIIIACLSGEAPRMPNMIWLFFMLFISAFLFMMVYFTTTNAYSNHIQMLFNLILIQCKARQECSKCETER